MEKKGRKKNFILTVHKNGVNYFAPKLAYYIISDVMNDNPYEKLSFTYLNFPIKIHLLLSLLTKFFFKSVIRKIFEFMKSN